MEAFPAHEALRGSNDRMPFNIGVFRVRHISFLLDMTDDTQESNASLNFFPHVDTLVVFSIFGQAIRRRPYSFHSRCMCTVDMILSMLRPTQENLVELLDDCSLDDELRNSS